MDVRGGDLDIRGRPHGQAKGSLRHRDARRHATTLMLCTSGGSCRGGLEWIPGAPTGLRGGGGEGAMEVESWESGGEGVVAMVLWVALDWAVGLMVVCSQLGGDAWSKGIVVEVMEKGMSRVAAGAQAEKIGLSGMLGAAATGEKKI